MQAPRRAPGWCRPRKTSRGSESTLAIFGSYAVLYATYQVIPQKLHDEGGVLVALLGQGVKLWVLLASSNCVRLDSKHTGNGVIESLLSQLASLVGGVEDLVVEDGEVQSETETDGVRGGQAASSDVGGSLVGLERLVGGGLTLVANSELGEVAVVVTLPASATLLALERPKI